MILVSEKRVVYPYEKKPIHSPMDYGLVNEAHFGFYAASLSGSLSDSLTLNCDTKLRTLLADESMSVAA